MTTAATALAGLFAGSALVDWWAVATGHRRVEVIAKPTTLVLLIAVALAIDPFDTTVRALFVLALAFGLAGDVFLLDGGRRNSFLAGLGCFAVGHGFYLAGLLVAGVSGVGVFVGLVVVAAGAATIGRRIVGDRIEVAFYLLLISAMLVAAFGVGHWLVIVGALLFYCSDALLGWNRFVSDLPGSRPLVHATYHVGQACLIAWLATSG